ncbi:hypothetical protein BDZ91DRAFT_765672 [Kalaharituber pfeilii]|nr:hypothetical protein BDZ91DRAFT_765672 [Kalaharituber pfeilii]
MLPTMCGDALFLALVPLAGAHGGRRGGVIYGGGVDAGQRLSSDFERAEGANPSSWQIYLTVCTRRGVAREPVWMVLGTLRLRVALMATQREPSLRSGVMTTRLRARAYAARLVGKGASCGRHTVPGGCSFRCFSRDECCVTVGSGTVEEESGLEGRRSKQLELIEVYGSHFLQPLVTSPSGLPSPWHGKCQDPPPHPDAFATVLYPSHRAAVRTYTGDSPQPGLSYVLMVTCWSAVYCEAAGGGTVAWKGSCKERYLRRAPGRMNEGLLKESTLTVKKARAKSRAATRPS